MTWVHLPFLFAHVKLQEYQLAIYNIIIAVDIILISTII